MIIIIDQNNLCCNPLRFLPPSQVYARDPDWGQNSALEYSLKGPRTKAQFRIHPTTGAISTRAQLKAGEAHDLLVRPGTWSQGLRPVGGA